MTKVADLIKNSILMLPKSLEKPRVSIILPTFRRFESGLFTSCVESLLAQTFVDFELIIVDDSSTDGTFDEIQKFCKIDARVGYIRHVFNIGLPAISTYEAYKVARGDLVFFAFDDNYFYNNALELLVAELTDSDSAVFGHVDLHVPNGDGEHIIPAFGFGLGVPLSTLHSHNYIPNNAVLIRSSVFDNIGWYDPHIIITRLCDWDLWRRLIAIYNFRAVNISVGRELGPTQNDSLGNTHLMPLTAIEEWMRRRSHTDELHLDNFEAYSVVACPQNTSTRVMSAIREASENFVSKSWWAESPELCVPEGCVLVITDTLDASTTLYFDVFSKSGLVVRILKADSWKFDELINARMVVFVRSIFSYIDWIESCKAANIPYYWFLDDNFFELSKFDNSYKAWRLDDKLRARISDFSGVFVSTESLSAYILENEISNNVIILPPIIPSSLQSTKVVESFVSNIAFVGGAFRHSWLLKFCLPAIERLNVPVNLFLVGVDKSTISDEMVRKLNIVFIEKDFSHQTVMLKLASLGISVLIHPGRAGVNDIYKTDNFIINCKILNCIPIVSTHSVFSRNEPNGLLVAEDSISSWEAAIKAAIFDEETNVKARKFIDDLLVNSDEVNNVNIFAREMLNTPYLSQDQICRRTNIIGGEWRQLEGGRYSNKEVIVKAIKSILRARLKSLIRFKIFKVIYLLVIKLPIFGRWIEFLKLRIYRW